MAISAARNTVRVFAGTLLTGCLAIAALNFVVNPMTYYPTRYFRPLVWSSRLIKSERMRELAPVPQVLIVGSSRAMQVSPREVARVTGLGAYNASVDSAMAEDYYALLRYALLDCRWPLRELIIGVDIEAFHDHQPPDARVLSAPLLARHMPAEMRWRAAGRAAGALLAYDQVLGSVRALGFTLRGYPAPVSRFDPDGYLHYITWEQQAAAGTFHADIEGSIASYEARFANFVELDRARRAAFEDLVALAAARGVRVRAFVTPLHPLVVTALRQRRGFDRLHAMLLAYLERQSARHPGGLVVRDFTAIDSFGGDPAMFWDGAHMREPNMVRLTEALLRDDDRGGHQPPAAAR